MRNKLKRRSGLVVVKNAVALLNVARHTEAVQLYVESVNISIDARLLLYLTSRIFVYSQRVKSIVLFFLF